MTENDRNNTSWKVDPVFLDFASCFIPLIFSNDENTRKTATTRVQGPHNTDLNSTLTKEFIDAIKINNKVPENFYFYASEDAFHHNGRIFAKLKLIDMVERTFETLTDQDAKVETYKTADELRIVLRQYYPEVENMDDVLIFYFEVIERYVDDDDTSSISSTAPYKLEKGSDGHFTGKLI